MQQTGRFAGFAVELVERYAQGQGLAAHWFGFRWPELVTDIQQGTFELAASGITVRPERSLVGRYSVPIAQTGSVLLIRPGATVPALPEDRATALGVLDAQGLRIGVNRGGHLERTARRFFPHAQIITFPENSRVPRALQTGELDAALTNTLEADAWAELNPGVVRFGPFTREDVAFFLRAETVALADSVDDWLLEREADGQLASLREAYFRTKDQPQTALVVSAVLAATAERLALMPWVAAAKARVQKPVEDLAQEERVRTAARQEIAEAARALNVEAPRAARLDSFVHAQLEAAKAIQRLPLAPDLPAYDLDTELRPAIARISHRLHRLVVRVPAALEPHSVAELAWSYLSESGLTRSQSDALAEALAALRRP